MQKLNNKNLKLKGQLLVLKKWIENAEIYSYNKGLKLITKIINELKDMKDE